MREQGPLERDITICHELMHIHMRDLDEAVSWLLNRSDESVSSAAYVRIGHEAEGLVDRVARAVVRHTDESGRLGL